jgi:hypothetical protein
VNFYKEKSYERGSLRAPYLQEVMFKDDKYVFKAIALNISVGGLLLKEVSYFPEDSSELSFVFKIPKFPYFKSFDFQKLSTYSPELLKAKVVKTKCRMVRKQEMKNNLDAIFTTNIGLQFLEISPYDKEIINEYVNVFDCNLFFLQTLIDSLNAKPDKLKYIQILSSLLGYDPNMKVALLNKKVIQDYRSLQWL